LLQPHDKVSENAGSDSLGSVIAKGQKTAPFRPVTYPTLNCKRGGNMSFAQGGCLCGELRYEVTCPPAKITMCHCKFCQRATGGAYMVQPVFNATDFTMTKGCPKIYTHVSAGSGKEVYVNFCDQCGTKVFLTFERFEGAVGLYGGALDDPNCIKATPDNSKHIFLKFGQPETAIPAHINVFAEHVVQGDGTPIMPIILDQPRKIADIKLA
jgi:hypothetical protein